MTSLKSKVAPQKQDDGPGVNKKDRTCLLLLRVAVVSMNNYACAVQIIDLILYDN